MKILNYSVAILLWASVFLAGLTKSDSTLIQHNVEGLGALTGTAHTTRTGRNFYAFRGLRYAAPPIGSRRFANPEPTPSWTGVYNATADGASCIQYNVLYRPARYEGAEDCLFLNVYTPKLPPSDGGLLPVIVTIHGGGFLGGEGSSQVTGADYFMDHDVVKVAFNYRLGPFGFLSTGDEAASGNWGFKDQLLVLKWVNQHIAGFGGDPGLVTIIGQSAGGASVHYHMLTQSDSGLFHRAISQSGTVNHLWAKPLPGQVAASLARQQAVALGCEEGLDNQGMVDCLRNIDAETLVLSAKLFKVWDIDPLTINLPVLESPSADAYLTEPPCELIKKGHGSRIPWMVSTVQNEGSIRTAGILMNDSLVNELNRDFSTLMPSTLGLTFSAPEEGIPFLLESLTNEYLHGKMTVESEGFIKLFSDRYFTHGIAQILKWHHENGHDSIYMYHFTYKPQDNYCKVFVGYKPEFGACHCDDLSLLYTSPKLGIQLIDENHKDYKPVK